MRSTLTFLDDSLVLEKQQFSPVVGALVFVGIAIYLSFFALTLHGRGDEGMVLVPAERILQGQIPYRDFFSELAPGTFYIQALWFKLFGISILSARIPMLLLMAVIGCQIFYLARRIIGGWPLFFCILLYTVAAFPRWLIASHHWYSIFFALCAVICLVHFQKRAGLHWIIACGISVSACALCLQSKGALLFIGILIILVWHGRSGTDQSHQALWRNLSAFLITVASLAVAVCFYFLFQNALGDLVNATAAYPFQSYLPAEFRLFPSLSSLFRHMGSLNAADLTRRDFGRVLSEFCWGMVVPLASILLAIKCWKARRHSAPTQQRWVLVSTYTVTGFSLMLSEMIRSDFIHLLFGAPLLLVVAVALFADLMGRDCRLWRMARVFFVVLIVFTSGVAVSLVVREGRRDQPIQTRRGRLYQNADRATKYQFIFDTIQSYVAEGHEVFFYPYSPLLYFLTATRNSTPFEYLIPGETNPKQFAAVIELLKQGPKPMWIFSFWKERKRSLPRLLPGVAKEVWQNHPVEDFLQSKDSPYRVVSEEANFIIFQRIRP